jgi:hypothetical protein
LQKQDKNSTSVGRLKKILCGEEVTCAFTRPLFSLQPAVLNVFHKMEKLGLGILCTPGEPSVMSQSTQKARPRLRRRSREWQGGLA